MPDAPPLAARRIAFDRLGGFPLLFRRYATGDEAALRFFAHDFRDPAALRAAAERAASLSRDRETLADVLAEQNARWGNEGEAVRANVEALRDVGSAAVVTGQQLGLFGGPLYTAYKAATAVRLARQMTEDTGRPAVPVFWLAGEDHDFEEVRATVVLSGRGPVRIALPPADDRTPVGRRVLGPEVETALTDLQKALRPTAFTPDLLAALRRSYRPGATMRDAFASWMAHLFAGSGLVFVSPDDARLKRLVAPVFRGEIERPGEALARLTDASEALVEAGFHRQVTPLPGNLFLMEPEGRFTLDPENGGFTLRGLGRRYTKEDLLALLAAEPERFSPNVVLRPVVEDRLLPTAAYVAGPGEASYYAQLRGVYDAFGVPMPVVYPRASVTLVEPAVQRVLERYGLAVPDLDPGPDPAASLEALHRRLALDLSEHDVEAAFAEARRRTEEAVDALKPLAVEADPTLERSAEATRAALRNTLGKLETRVVRAEKRNHALVRERLERARAALYPVGKPQERVLSALSFLNTYGPALVAEWLDSLDLNTAAHQVLEV